MHVDPERLERLVDAELDPGATAEVLDHLATCAGCRARLDQRRRERSEVLALIQALDGPESAGSPAFVAPRAWPARAGSGPGRVVRPDRVLKLAAGVGGALILIGAAWALPGSPLRHWTIDLARRLGPGPREVHRPDHPDGDPAPLAPVPAGAGIAVAPGDRLVIAFAHAAVGGTVRVRIIDSDRVRVEGPPDGARFETGGGRVVVHNPARPTHYEVGIPRTAPLTIISVADVVRFRREEGTVTGVAAAGPDSSWILPLRP